MRYMYMNAFEIYPFSGCAYRGSFQLAAFLRALKEPDQI